ncbi:hypothetical protein KI387_014238, partial [Taxus chinensis]
WLIIIISGGIMLLSFAGFVGACFRVTSLLWLYLFFMLLLILAYLGCIIFAFAVTDKGNGQAVLGTGFSEYRLGDFSKWMQNHVKDAGSWQNIRLCVRDAGVCKRLGAKTVVYSSAGFFQQRPATVFS